MNPIFMKFYRIIYAVIYLMFTRNPKSGSQGRIRGIPISINIYINTMKFFYHLGDLSKRGNYLISTCLFECYKDLF